MSKMQFGNITATNMQTGDGNVQNIGSTLSVSDRSEVLKLIEQLQRQVQTAPLPEATKKEVREQVVPAMQQAAQSTDPKAGLTDGLKRLNTKLEQVDTAGKSLNEIVGTAAKIAGVVGTAFKVAAPFLSGLL